MGQALCLPVSKRQPVSGPLADSPRWPPTYGLTAVYHRTEGNPSGCVHWRSPHPQPLTQTPSLLAADRHRWPLEIAAIVSLSHSSPLLLSSLLAFYSATSVSSRLVALGKSLSRTCLVCRDKGIEPTRLGQILPSLSPANLYLRCNDDRRK